MEFFQCTEADSHGFGGFVVGSVPSCESALESVCFESPSLRAVPVVVFWANEVEDAFVLVVFEDGGL